jgi:lysozyme family protein
MKSLATGDAADAASNAAAPAVAIMDGCDDRIRRRIFLDHSLGSVFAKLFEVERGSGYVYRKIPIPILLEKKMTYLSFDRRFLLRCA